MKHLFWTMAMAACLQQAQAQYNVGHFTETYFDAARSRNVPTEVYYPTDANGNPATDDFPVIVFGHGFVMAYSAYQNLWEEWVPMGYIMAFPTTEGSLFPTPSHSMFASDLSFLVGALQAADTDAASDLFGMVAPKTALMGHSMGGGCSFLAAANNSTIATVVGLAPAETNPSAITVSPQIAVPTLVLSGENDGVTPPADNHLPMYTGSAAACKAFVSILGGAHCYFANTNFNCDFGESTSSSGISITRAEQQQFTYDFVTPWLDYYLKGDCAAWAQLEATLVADATQGVDLQHVCTFNAAPDIALQDSTFSTTASASSYQWLLNGTPIANADAATWTAQESGIYSVEVTYADGCSFTSDTLHYTEPVIISGTAFSWLDAADLYVYQGVLYYKNMPSDATLLVSDALGRLQLQALLPDGSGQLLLNNLPEGGIYGVSVSAKGEQRAWRVRL